MTREAFLDMISNTPNVRYDVQDGFGYMHLDLKWDEVAKHLPQNKTERFIVVVDFGTLNGNNIHTILQYYGKGNNIEGRPWGDWWRK